MKLLLYSDVHWGDSTIESCTLALQSLGDYVDEYRPDVVINLGDTFHPKDAVSARTLSAATRAFDTLCQRVAIACADHFAIHGNHDVGDRAGAVSSAEILRLAGVRFPDREYRLDTGNGVIGFLSFGGEADDIRAVAGIMADSCSVIVSHVPLLGAIFAPGKADTDGHALDAAGLGVARVFSGHYHHPQTFRAGDTEVCVVGSPAYHTWGDLVIAGADGKALPRGFVLVDTDDWSVRRLPARGVTVRHTLRPDDLLGDKREARDRWLAWIREAHPDNPIALRIASRDDAEAAIAIAQELATDLPEGIEVRATATLRTNLPTLGEIKFESEQADTRMLLDRLLTEAGFGEDSAVRARTFEIYEQVRV